jgi:FecR protein
MRFSHAFFCALLGVPLFVHQITLLSPAAAAVYSPQRALPAQTIQEFLANPTALLAQYPDGGGRLIARVRDLAASDPSTLSALIGLLATANSDQAIAIGTGLGQTALMAVKTDQAYANEIQEAIANAGKNRGAGGGNAGVGSSQPNIGNAVKTKDEVEGVTERGSEPLTAGREVYLNELVRTGDTGKAELLFADRTNLTVGPVTTIRLDKFVYDPGGGSGTVVFQASAGSFRFITGIQGHKNYAVKTPFATMGVRGTEFYVVITPDSNQIQLVSGEVIVTTISGKVVSLTNPNVVLSVDSHGNTQTTPANQPLVNFADLGSPVTSISFADALATFAAVTGNSAIGATGVGGGGAGGGVGGGGAGPPSQSVSPH